MLMYLRALVVAGLLLVSGCATRRAAERSFIEIVFQRLPAVGGSAASDDLQRQVQAMALAQVGREDRIANMGVQLHGMPPSDCQTLMRDGREVDPLAEIVRRAGHTRVVIINEAHDLPQGRALISDVVAALRPLGYSIYAAETFSPTVQRKGPSYPVGSDGQYSNEPTFGDLLRRARSLGYAFVPYEIERRPTSNDPTNEREESEADNLVRRIFSDDPHARVVIHVGYSHARKLEQDGVRWMAMRLQQKIGIVPLSVDQTTFGPIGNKWRVCAATADGKPLDPAFDLQIVAPALRFDRGRPTWRSARGQRPVPIPAALRRPNERVIFEARRADEPDDAVPVDRILVDPGEDLPFLLPVGSYRVRAKMMNSPWSAPVTVRVR